MKKIAKKILKLVIEDYETYENFCREHHQPIEIIHSLKEGDQEAYVTVASLLYGYQVKWREMDNPVAVEYRSIDSKSNGVYTVDLVGYGVVEIDQSSMNIDRIDCQIYVEKDFLKEL